MNFRDSVLFATVMTLADELKNKEQWNVEKISQDTKDKINIEFNFNNLQSKGKLIALIEKIIEKANNAVDFADIETSILISAIITRIIYESVKSTDAEYEVKNKIFNYAFEYCNLQPDFSLDMLNSDNTFQIENVLKELCDKALDLVFVISSNENCIELSDEFIRVLTELMMYLDNSFKETFPTVTFTKKAAAITIEYLMAAMEKELHRLEEKDPSLKNSVNIIDDKKTNQLHCKAREALENGNQKQAAIYYKEIAHLKPDDWAAVFYTEFCSVFDAPNMINTAMIKENTNRISLVMDQTMPLIKKQVLIRPQLISELTIVCANLSKLSANYFVAIMDEYKNSSKNAAEKMHKSTQVNHIMQMLFFCGDSIENNFNDDLDLRQNLCTVCWKLAFECYENCDMNAPSNLTKYFYKIHKFDSAFICSKSLTETIDTRKKEGCYVATAIYGSYDCPQVWTLRRYRDLSLKQSLSGRGFIRIYYAISPLLLKLFGRTKLFNNICKKILDKFIISLQLKGFNDTSYNDNITNE